jgi:hypothetical protein
MMKIRMDRVRRSGMVICIFWVADRRRAGKSMNMSQLNVKLLFMHTVARLQKTDETSEVMSQVLDNRT